MKNRWPYIVLLQIKLDDSGVFFAQSISCTDLHHIDHYNDAPCIAMVFAADSFFCPISFRSIAAIGYTQTGIESA